MSIASIYARNNCRQRAIYPDGIETLISALCLGASNDLLAVCKPNNIIQESYMINGPDIKSATAIFTKQSLSLSYSDLIKFYIGVFSIKQSAAKTAVMMNKYIYEHCGLTDIISEDMIAVSDIIGINVLWFKDTWVIRFKQVSKMRNFMRSDNTIVNLHYIWLEDVIQVYKGPNGEVAVALRFKHGAVAELIMGLPVSDSFTSQILSYNRKRVYMAMPKFKHKERIELDSIIKQSIYAPMYVSGNLNNMTGNRTLKVNSMFQQIECEFNERGAEVKAATVGLSVIAVSALCEPEHIEFNRPFHYRIKKQNTILLAGYYNGI